VDIGGELALPYIQSTRRQRKIGMGVDWRGAAHCRWSETRYDEALALRPLLGWSVGGAGEYSHVPDVVIGTPGRGFEVFDEAKASVRKSQAQLSLGLR
jgi:hypothetical protein